MVEKILFGLTKKEILKKAKIKKGTVTSNIKLGNMGSWSMLFGNVEWYIPEYDFYCKGTCGEHCSGCFDPENPKKSACYVAKAYYQHTNRTEDGEVGNMLTDKCTVKTGHAMRTIAMMHFRDDLLESLDKQLTRMRDKFEMVRINESGELMCKEDLMMWNELSRRHPETTFYIYTKNYKAVKGLLKKEDLASNLFVNISIWHNKGIKEYLQLKDIPQIRAFVFVDKEWTIAKYKTKGIDIAIMCPAYDENGVMNHNVTCDKCKLCAGYQKKVVGCFEH